MHEEILRGRPREILGQLKSRPTIKGEITIVIESQEALESGESEDAELSVVEHVAKLMAEGVTEKEAIRRVAQLRGLPKREGYSRVMAHKKTSQPLG